MYKMQMMDQTHSDQMFSSKSGHSPKKSVPINERTFCLLLFVVSLTIVVGKLIVLYGDGVPSMIKGNLPLPDVKKYLDYSKAPNPLTFLSNEKYTNEAYNQTNTSLSLINVMDLYEYGWLVKAAFSGLAILGVTWFIVYKDSSIPGVNPPSPFSPSQRRFSSDNSKLQMNYFIGVINGLLMFIYMCLN